MSHSDQILSIRGSTGVRFIYGPPTNGDCTHFPKDENPNCKDLTFTRDGNLVAWCSNQRVAICNSEGKDVSKINDPRISNIQFSPKGTYLSTWSQYVVKENPQESCNLHIWNVITGERVKSFIQKKQLGWAPQWTDDEHLCARSVSNEVHFFEDAKFDKIAKKIHMQKVAYFSLAFGPSPYHIACFVPGVKGQPSFVRVFKFPNFEGNNSVIAQKSFFKAERVDFYWNKTGKDCIILTSVDVDKSGASYYGELNLYYVSVKGDTAKIKLGKDGPVYSVQWSPYSTEFCVVYGCMPARATIYSLKCEPVLDFDSGPRNEILYSPVGDRLSLSGFGNLQGQIEIWDLKAKKQISKFKATDSTAIQWSNDGEYIMTATTSPRLRIGNGYRVWHYTGSLLTEVFLPSKEELYDIRWKPVPDVSIKAKPTIYTPVPGIKSAQAVASEQAYRPPAAQGKAASFKLHDEPKSENNDSKQLSKSQKKKIARKAKKESEKDEENEESIAPQPNSPVFTAPPSSGDPEKDKKIRSLLKKLEQIEKLKSDQQSGKQLELNQLEKIKKGSSLLAELENLQLN